MNFVHAADIHFDTPFIPLSNRENLGEERRLEQRKAFKTMINFIKEKRVEYLFITGDLYEEQHIRKSTIDYINNLFKEIPETKIYMVPGNHDPYLKNSYYSIYNWNENVRIFTEKIEHIHSENINIYGFGFNDFEMDENQLEKINIENKNEINILLAHGDVYTKSKYNPMDKNKLISKEFDYIALGHLHKRDEFYPGSLISLGFDEPGEHGFSYVEINDKKEVNKTFIKADERELISLEIDVSNLQSKEELIETINEIQTNNNLYEIYLVGTRNFETDISIKLIQKDIIKIKDKTKFKKEIIKNEKTLTGIFERKLNEKLQSGEIDESTYQKVLELESKIMQK